MSFLKPQYVPVIFALFMNTTIVVAQSDENISVCIVDPATPSGFRMQEAKVRAGGDTVVSVGTAARPIGESLPTFPLARFADWYITGKPLVIGTGTHRMRLFTYWSAQVLTSDKLVPIGFVRGMPLYADRREAAPLMEEFKATYPHVPARELSHILDTNPSVRARMDQIRLFYTPIVVVGCVFQAVIRGEDLRN
jgi:hypothetical protein